MDNIHEIPNIIEPFDPRLIEEEEEEAVQFFSVIVFYLEDYFV